MSRWSEFYARHGERKFTPVFNSYLEALMADESALVSERVDAWILRTSWGNHADSCVNAEGIILTQTDCARQLVVERRQANAVFVDRKRRGYLRFDGRAIVPIDQSRAEATFADSSLECGTFPPSGEEEANMPRFTAFFEQIWAAEHPDEYRAYQIAEQKVKEVRAQALNEWRPIARQLSERYSTLDDGKSGEVQDKTAEGYRAPDPSILIGLKPLNIKGSSSSVSVPGKKEQEPQTTTTSTPSHKKEKEKEKCPNVVVATIANYTSADQAAVTQLVERCRRAAPTVTDEEISKAIHAKAPLADKNVVGFLLTAVPAMLAGDGLEQIRAGLPPPASLGRKKNGPDTSYLDAIIAGGGDGD